MKRLVILSIPIFCLSIAGAAFTQGTYVAFGKGCPGSGQSNVTPGTIFPASLRTQMGRSGNYFGVGKADQIYQQVFLGSEAPKPLVVMGYGLRHLHQNSGGVQQYRVTFGYTTYDHSSITANFKSNFNARGPGTVVFQGQVKIPALTGANTNVDRFPFEVKFTRPWVYTPITGHNIIWQLENTSTTSSVNGYDAASNVTTTRIYASPATSTTGTVHRNFGLAIKLFTPGAGVDPKLSNTGLPIVGTPFSIDLSQAKASTAAGLITGFSQTKFGAFALPLDLTAAGAPGCSLLVSFDILLAVPTDSSGKASTKFPIPNDPKLRGLIFYNQFFVLDPTKNALGLVWSNAAKATIG